MAGRGPAPKINRQNAADVPIRGEWQPTRGIGWQHGELPRCPVRGRRALATWNIWLTSWFASHWGPEDLPVLDLVIKLWARADSGEATGAERSELRQLMDSCGITRKGQQDRRWAAPAAPAESEPEEISAVASPYSALRVIGA